ncbi:MAG TPA: T9SS type A sorting domain-containing protein, partial [Chitinophagales bacterium]|nr:T9SS type A sorting domain-containing protein [Chitinophagales bacterium]
EGGDYTLTLFDVCGRVVYNQNIRAITGTNLKTIPLNGTADGIYSLILQKGNEVLRGRLIIR